MTDRRTDDVPPGCPENPLSARLPASQPSGGARGDQARDSASEVPSRPAPATGAPRDAADARHSAPQDADTPCSHPPAASRETGTEGAGSAARCPHGCDTTHCPCLECDAAHAIPSPDPQPAQAREEAALRDARRDSLGVLLARAERDVLTAREATQLRAHVEAELRDSDRLRHSLRSAAHACTMLDDHRNELRAERDRLAKRIGEYRASRRRWMDAAYRDRHAAVYAHAALQRLDGIATAWLERLPETVRTATVAEAVHATVRPALRGEQPAASGRPEPEPTSSDASTEGQR